MVTHEHVKAYSKHYYTIPWQRVADFAPALLCQKGEPPQGVILRHAHFFKIFSGCHGKVESLGL